MYVYWGLIHTLLFYFHTQCVLWHDKLWNISINKVDDLNNALFICWLTKCVIYLHFIFWSKQIQNQLYGLPENQLYVGNWLYWHKEKSEVFFSENGFVRLTLFVNTHRVMSDDEPLRINSWFDRSMNRIYSDTHTSIRWANRWRLNDHKVL